MIMPSLYAHQVSCLAAMDGQRAFALLLEMGTGKTRVLIEDWARLVRAGKSQDLLIIAPSGMYRNWVGELDAWLDPAIRERAHIHVWDSSLSKKARALLIKRLSVPYLGPRVFLVNVEALSGVVEAQKACELFLSSKVRNAMAAIDESTCIKNPRAQRTKFIVKLGRLAAWRRIMSGLPAPQSPLDVFSQFAFLDPAILGFSSFFAFRARYAVMKKVRMNGRDVNIIVGYRRVDELHARIARFSFRVRKDECLDLPPKVYAKREVQLTPDQKRHYTSLCEAAIAMLEDGSFVTIEMAVTLVMRLHQLVCGYLVDESGTIHDVPSKRIESLMELLDEHAGKAIIWAPYRKSIADIAARLRKEYGDKSVVEYWGNVTGDDRVEAVRRFQNDPECRFLVGNPATGGKGITLTEASLVIYFANSYDLEQRAQSEDRAHRSGLTHSVTYVDLVAPRTIDEKIVKALASKINLASQITGDGLRSLVS